MGSRAFKPEDLYVQIRPPRDGGAIPPDLMIYFGDLRWRSVGSLGLPGLYTFENDTGPDDANHDQYGVFVLWDPRKNYGGRSVDGLQLMDVAPTVLDLMGLQSPEEMQGRIVPR